MAINDGNGSEARAQRMLLHWAGAAAGLVILAWLGWMSVSVIQLGTGQAGLVQQVHSMHQSLTQVTSDRYTGGQAAADRALLSNRLSSLETEMHDAEVRIRALERALDRGDYADPGYGGP